MVAPCSHHHWLTLERFIALKSHLHPSAVTPYPPRLKNHQSRISTTCYSEHFMELEVYSMGSIVAGFFYLAQCLVGQYPLCDTRQHVNTLRLYG